MGEIFADIRRIVEEDISNRITQFDVLFEAITNAINANATEIVCELYSNDNPIECDGKRIVKRKVGTIVVSDNGDGLDDENYNSFCRYRSGYKKELGCKGVGRFVFLKVYDYAEYKSLMANSQEERSFKFCFGFDTDDIVKTTREIKLNRTELRLSGLSIQYLNYDKHVDRRIDLDLELIREKVLLNLIPTLFFYKKKGIYIQISFIDKTTEQDVLINSSNVPDFEDNRFHIAGRDGKDFEFILHYKIECYDGKLYAFHCANNRTVCDFSDKDLKISLPLGYSGYFLLESLYFDKRVNNERNDFDIYPVRTDLYSSISWELINDNLKKAITALVKKSIPEAEKINREKINQIHEERPYLINYMDESDIGIAGFLDKKKLLENAKKRFDIAKENVLSNAGKDEYTDSELYEAIDLAQNELVSYVNDRVQVIERLRKLAQDKERVESIIHNLFMEKQTDDDYFCIGKNNLWLLDDRFTTYTYAASDKRIKEVIEEIGEEAGDIDVLNDRPDLSLFFSHNPTNPERLKSVLVEIKPFDFKSKPDRKKFAGIQQLVDYVEAFKSKENIEEIFAFLITDIDAKLSARLRKDDYVPLFSLEHPIFHRFYKEVGISIYVISALTLIKDAEARNKVFLDIIKRQVRIKSLLSK